MHLRKNETLKKKKTLLRGAVLREEKGKATGTVAVGVHLATFGKPDAAILGHGLCQDAWPYMTEKTRGR